MILTLAAWLATAAILLSYARTTQDPAKANAFHAANVFGCIPLIILNVQAAVWPAVVVNLGFGIPAAYALLKARQRPHSRQSEAPSHRAGGHTCRSPHHPDYTWRNK